MAEMGTSPEEMEKYEDVFKHHPTVTTGGTSHYVTSTPAVNSRGLVDHGPLSTNDSGYSSNKKPFVDSSTYSRHLESQSPPNFDLMEVHDQSELSNLSLPTLDYSSCCMSVNADNVKYVDFISNLSNITPALCSILHNVHGCDLCSMSLVSRTWYRVISQDRLANERRLHYIEGFRKNKENKSVSKKSSLKRTFSTADQPLAAIQTTAEPHSTIHLSPAVDRAQQFRQVASSLASGESLRKCPHCNRPARVDGDRATCTYEQCSYDFCVFCRCKYHAPASCRPSRPVLKMATVGSKRSKKNLKRLCQ